MFPYFTLLAAIFVMILFDSKRFGKLVFFILAIWMFIFSAFRVGGMADGDYDAYQRFYLTIDTFEKVLNPNLHVEIGFRFLSFVGHLGNFDKQYIIVAMAALSLVPTMYIIYKYSPYRILSLLVWMPYFLTMNMHSSRTAVAATFGLLFIIFFYEKKKILALLNLLLAISFHSAALVLILIYLTVLHLKILLVIFVLIFSIFLVASPLEIILLLLDTFRLGYISSAIELYVISDDYGYPMLIYDPRILLNIGIFFLLFRYREKLYEKFHFNEYFLKLYMIGILLMLVFSSVTIVAWRTSYYFLLIGVIAIPWLARVMNIIFYKKYKVRFFASSIFAVLYSFYAVSLILKSLPYNFLFG